jgi:hypothetical protein
MNMHRTIFHILGLRTAGLATVDDILDFGGPRGLGLRLPRHSCLRASQDSQPNVRLFAPRRRKCAC